MNITTITKSDSYNVKADGTHAHSYDILAGNSVYHVAAQGQIYQYVGDRWTNRSVMRRVTNPSTVNKIRYAIAQFNA
jgi:hypothetical protein